MLIGRQSATMTLLHPDMAASVRKPRKGAPALAFSVVWREAAQGPLFDAEDEVVKPLFMPSNAVLNDLI
jgi:hypothetical protein